MNLRCKLCGVEFDQLPPQAAQVGNPRGSYRLYLIDGQLHDLGSTQLGRKKSAAKPQEKS
jgi:hypothetical protein